MTDPVTLALLSIVAVFALVLLHVPIGVAMGVVGVVGFGLMTNFTAAVTLIATEPASLLSNLDIAVIPLFLLMGGFATAGGISDDIYRLAYALLGHRRGGLAVSTVLGCAAFGSIAGSSTATTATFGRIALPQMLARRYSPAFASGTIAIGGTLGTMIPPSVVMTIYALVAELFIIDLFIAAAVPALMAVAFYLAVIWIIVKLRPEWGPPGPRLTWRETWPVVKQSWAVLLLFLTVSGGIYGGVFTVTEAAALGAVMTFVFAVLRGKMTRAMFWRSLRDTASTTAMIYVAVFGATILGSFIGLTRVSDEIVRFFTSLNVAPVAVIFLLVVMYLILGAVFDEGAAMLITLPFVLPVVVQLGYDPVWWGIINVIVICLGMVIPPIGLNVFVLHGLQRNISLGTIYKGVAPFILVDLVRLSILIVWPGLTLWLLTVLK